MGWFKDAIKNRIKEGVKNSVKRGIAKAHGFKESGFHLNLFPGIGEGVEQLVYAIYTTLAIAVALALVGLLIWQCWKHGKRDDWDIEDSGDDDDDDDDNHLGHHNERGKVEEDAFGSPSSFPMTGATRKRTVTRDEHGTLNISVDLSLHHYRAHCRIHWAEIGDDETIAEEEERELEGMDAGTWVTGRDTLKDGLTVYLRRFMRLHSMEIIYFQRENLATKFAMAMKLQSGKIDKIVPLTAADRRPPIKMSVSRMALDALYTIESMPWPTCSPAHMAALRCAALIMGGIYLGSGKMYHSGNRPRVSTRHVMALTLRLVEMASRMPMTPAQRRVLARWSADE